MKKTLLSSAIVLLVTVLAAVSYAQNFGGGRAGGPGGPGGFDRAAMQERMAQMMQQQLEISDEEWIIIGPRLTKVMTLSRETGPMAGMGRMFGRGGRNGGPGAGQDRRGRNDQPDANAPEEEVSDLQKASDELSTILEKADATPAEIKAKLTDLRTAREKSRQDLIKAQEELKEVLSLKQEAKLVMSGMLE